MCVHVPGTAFLTDKQKCKGPGAILCLEHSRTARKSAWPQVRKPGQEGRVRPGDMVGGQRRILFLILMVKLLGGATEKQSSPGYTLKTMQEGGREG